MCTDMSSVLFASEPFAMSFFANILDLCNLQCNFGIQSIEVCRS